MLQWLTGTGSVSSNDYYTQLQTVSYNGSNISFKIKTDSTYFLRAIKINVLILAKQMNGQNLATYQLASSYSSNTWSNKPYNLGIEYNAFNSPLDGHCLFSLFSLNFREPAGSLVKVLLQFSGSDISNIVSTFLDSISFDTICLGICPVG